MKFIEAAPESVTSQWPKSNYDHPESRRYLSFVFEVPFTTLATFIVALRVYIRLRSRTFGYDDAVIALAVPFAIAMTYLDCANMWGIHVWDIRPERIKGVQGNLYAMEITAIISHYLTKLSILLFYRRIFKNALDGVTHILIVIGFVYVFTFTPVALAITALQCLPVHAFWDVSLQPRRCINSYAVVLVVILVGCAGNFYLFFLPLGKVRKLQMKKAQKQALMVTLGIGLFTCLLSLAKAGMMAMPFAVSDWDYTWNGLCGTILCIIENDLTIICASLPALKHLMSSTKGNEKPDYASSTSSKGKSVERGSEGKGDLSGIEKETCIETSIEIIVTKAKENPTNKV